MTKVLLVEDNELNRDMIARRLTRRGYSVEVAVDGEEAMYKLANMAPDLILMDMGLPGMDGLEATRRIKSDAALAGIPIIVLTANATTVDRDNAFAAGCDDFETKPIQLPQLLRKIERCLGQTPEPDPGQGAP